MKTVRKISVGAKAPPKRKRVAVKLSDRGYVAESKRSEATLLSDRVAVGNSHENTCLVLSLSAQISYYSGLIQKNPEWEFAGVYADRFVSGTSAERRA